MTPVSITWEPRLISELDDPFRPMTEIAEFELQFRSPWLPGDPGSPTEEDANEFVSFAFNFLDGSQASTTSGRMNPPDWLFALHVEDISMAFGGKAFDGDLIEYREGGGDSLWWEQGSERRYFYGLGHREILIGAPEAVPASGSTLALAAIAAALFGVIRASPRFKPLP